jgi:hypothetical protein
VQDSRRPYQMAEQKQAVERGAIQNQIGRAQIQMLPWQIMPSSGLHWEDASRNRDTAKTQAETQAIPVKTATGSRRKLKPRTTRKIRTLDWLTSAPRSRSVIPQRLRWMRTKLRYSASSQAKKSR